MSIKVIPTHPLRALTLQQRQQCMICLYSCVWKWVCIRLKLYYKTYENGKDKGARYFLGLLVIDRTCEVFTPYHISYGGLRLFTYSKWNPSRHKYNTTLYIFLLKNHENIKRTFAFFMYSIHYSVILETKTNSVSKSQDSLKHFNFLKVGKERGKTKKVLKWLVKK